MHFAGDGTGLSVMEPIEIQGQWESLASAAQSMASAASSAAGDMESAAFSWGGLVSSYEESATQDVVRAALDQAPQVTREWSDVATRASAILQQFATEASGLESRALSLQIQAARLRASLQVSNLLSGGEDGESAAESDALRREIEEHNNDVLGLNSQWEQLEQQTASELDTLAGRGGVEDGIPPQSNRAIPGTRVRG